MLNRIQHGNLVNGHICMGFLFFFLIVISVFHFNIFDPDIIGSAWDL